MIHGRKRKKYPFTTFLQLRREKDGEKREKIRDGRERERDKELGERIEGRSR